MRWFAAFVLGLAGLSAATAQAQSPTDAQMRMAVAEITEYDPKALAAVDAMIAGRAGDVFAADWLEGYRAAAILFHGLWETDRLAYLDWAEGGDEALSQLQRVFVASGLNWSQDQAERIRAELARVQLERGDAVGFVYMPLQRLAGKQGYWIMGINMGSDAHSLFVTRKGVAERWEDVALGQGMFIEHPDWQFAPQMRAAGQSPRHDSHPSTRARRAPQP